MDALKIAFETVIVGALALPWIVLVIDLFCPAKEKLIAGVLAGAKDQTQIAVAGAVLFAMAYLVGSAMGRVAEDIFNDDDLGTRITEDAIRTEVYCNPGDPWLVRVGGVLKGKDGTPLEGASLCAGDAENAVRQTFAIQESHLLLITAGDAERIRYLHQQTAVLRGAALDVLLATFLCVFGVCATHGVWGRALLAALSLAMLYWTIHALWIHLRDHWPYLAGEPPLMEILLMMIAAAGICLAWKNVPDRSYGCGLAFGLLLSVLAISGLWYSEILYDRTVIYFYDALSPAASALVR